MAVFHLTPREDLFPDGESIAAYELKNPNDPVDVQVMNPTGVTFQNLQAGVTYVAAGVTRPLHARAEITFSP